MDSRINLVDLDEYCMRQIVRKMSEQSGPRIYRSCKTMKREIERIRPRWGNRGIRLLYHSKFRSYVKKCVGSVEVNGLLKPDDFIEFHRIRSINVGNCSSDFFEKVIVPDLEKLKGLENLELDVMSEENLTRLLTLSRPTTIHFSDFNYKGDEHYFQNIPNLCIRVHMNNASSYWKTSKIFKLGKKRKSISISCDSFYEDLIVQFLARWLNGDDTGSLEMFSIHSRGTSSQPATIESIMNRVELQDLMSRYEKTPQNEYVIERQDKRRMVIQFGRDFLQFNLQ